MMHEVSHRKRTVEEVREQRLAVLVGECMEAIAAVLKDKETYTEQKAFVRELQLFCFARGGQA